MCVWAIAYYELVDLVIVNITDDAMLWLFWLFDTLSQPELERFFVGEEVSYS